MFDIETMGNGPKAAIISIAAVYFDETGLGKSFYHKVSLGSSVAAGLQMDADTVLWWLKQSDESRNEFQTKGDHLQMVLKKLEEFVEPDCKIWGNGAGFDNVILENAFRICFMTIPWKFYNNRCFRTLKNLYPNIYIPKNEAKHNALEDAKWQANYASTVFQLFCSMKSNIH